MLNSLSATFAPIVLKFFFILIGILGLSFLIAFHELGHFLFAKLFHVRTPSFSIGFGPKLFSKKIGTTEFSLSAIPLGGYVELAGAAEVGQGEQKDAHATDEGSFAVKPFYQKLCIMFGGILFNLLFAYCAMTILFMTGIPPHPLMYLTNGAPIITGIIPGSAAEKYNLQIGDRIIAIEGQQIGDDISLVSKTLAPLANKEVSFTIERNNAQFTESILIDSKADCAKPTGTLGISSFYIKPTPPHSFFDAIKGGVAITNTWIKATIAGFSNLFSKSGVSSVSGPIGIIAVTVNAAAEGFKVFILLLVLISVSLAVLNLIPLPVLDGGQILFYTIEAVIGRPIPERIREYIHITTWVFLLIFIVCISGKDIYYIIKPSINTILSSLKLR